MLTPAIIGDLASHFGCTIGLKDSVTAVIFVAFGTSVPGESEGFDWQRGILPGSSEPSDLPHYLPYHLRSELKVHEGQPKGLLLPLRMIINIS